MTKIPLGVSKYFQLLYILFFIIYKLIALGIIGIGQAIKNFIFEMVTVVTDRFTRTGLRPGAGRAERAVGTDRFTQTNLRPGAGRAQRAVA